MLTMNTYKDSMTGCRVQTIGQSGTDTSHYYFTAMTWLADSRRLIASTQIDADKKCSYVLIDTETGHSTVLANGEQWAGGVVSSDDKLYFPRDNSVQVIDLNTLKSWTVCELASGDYFGEPLSVSDDAAVLGVYGMLGGQSFIGTVDVAAGKLTHQIAPGFARPYEIANHAMVNPVYDHLVLFAHEGKTEHIPDRLWLYDTVASRLSNIYEQQQLQDGSLGEYIGHEMWAADGEGAYFVRYKSSPITPTGIYYVDRHRSQGVFINGDYGYWHAAASPDGNWIVADTHEHPSKLVLIDLRDHSSRVLTEVPLWWNHPGHPHPSFSPDSRKVTYTFADDENHLWIGIIDIYEVLETKS
ncbi:oligogalacturonate lyase family protein [Paenibacillus sp. WQ 127069]|uniref:Oligogalacturonate lyase family protein n=1 Tax=Paenibacillus baimaensis TaxID=2982185 RepID=A0ABT2UMV0_9BACL|nr:oligogalacturonate lyase family protein [Paenibacillus sp. WQ 127069]MCU6795983.1 oligogalacturonate lyase family protein [Paenibacillus sp. WQ 127069]